MRCVKMLGRAIILGLTPELSAIYERGEGILFPESVYNEGAHVLGCCEGKMG